MLEAVSAPSGGNPRRVWIHTCKVLLEQEAQPREHLGNPEEAPATQGPQESPLSAKGLGCNRAPGYLLS
jgi:hypothetical protein